MKHLLIVALAFWLALTSAIAQNTIQVIPEMPKSLTTDQTQNFNKYLRIPNSRNHQLIQFGQIETSQHDGQLSVNMPGRSQPYTFKAKRVEYLDANNYVWDGERMEGSMLYPDHLILTMTNGLLAGEISIEEHFYRILPVSENYQAMFEMNEEGGVACGNRLSMTGSEEGGGDAEPCTMNEDVCGINVMIAYTNAAQNAYPHMLAIGRTLIEQVNTAMRRSKIKHRWRLVDVVPVVDPWFDLDADGEIDHLADLLSTSSFIRDNRENSNADVVVVLSMGINFGSVFGIANASPPTPELACAVVKVDAGLGGRLTFTHELGHTLGAQHDNENCCLPARAHQFTSALTGKTYKSVLHTLELNAQRILNYSNPNVSYFGAPTGEVERNNACVMQNNGCSIASLLPSSNCTFAAKGFFDQECKAKSLFVSIITGDNPPQICNMGNLFYRFEYSLDGVNYSDGCDGGDPFCEIPFGAALLPDQTVFVRVTISDGMGIVATMFEWFTPNCPNGPVEIDPGHLRPSTVTKAQGTANPAIVEIYPTITDGNVYLKCNTPEQLRSVKIIDVFGKVVQEFVNFEMVNDALMFSLRDVPGGTYFVFVELGTAQKTFKLVKI